MKKILFITVFTVFAFSSFSQDYMLLKTGEKTAVTILTNADEYVRYRLFDDRTGKMYAIDKSKISKLIFDDGRIETYSEEPAFSEEAEPVAENRDSTTIQNDTNQIQPPKEDLQKEDLQKEDLLFFGDGKVKPVVVLEITPDFVKYRNFDNGPVYSVYKSEITKIILRDGTIETFAEKTESLNTNTQQMPDKDEQPKVTPPNHRRSIRFGVKGGVNFSTFSGLDKTFDLINKQPEINYESEYKIAFHAGLMCRIDLSNRFFCQPELLVSLQGDKGKKEEELKKESFEDDLLYLQLPVRLVYKLTIVPGWDMLLGAGPYLAYGIYGSKKTFDEDFNRLDYGFSFMAGFQFGKIQLTGAYDLGKNKIITGKEVCKDIDNIDTDGLPAFYTRNLKISAGYFF